MLKIAFDRKLTFVIGTSYTSGKENSIIWNEIIINQILLEELKILGTLILIISVE